MPINRDYLGEVHPIPRPFFIVSRFSLGFGLHDIYYLTKNECHSFSDKCNLL